MAINLKSKQIKYIYLLFLSLPEDCFSIGFSRPSIFTVLFFKYSSRSLDIKSDLLKYFRLGFYKNIHKIKTNIKIFIIGSYKHTVHQYIRNYYLQVN